MFEKDARNFRKGERLEQCPPNGHRSVALPVPWDEVPLFLYEV